MARRLGATDELVEAVQGRGDASALDGLEPAWRTALEYADVVHRSGHEVTDELFARLAAAWDPGQVVELTTVIGMAEYFNRFNDALRVEPTR